MVITGKNLRLLRDALERAISDVNMTIGMTAGGGPAADQDIVELEHERGKYDALLVRVEVSIAKEEAQCPRA